MGRWGWSENVVKETFGLLPPNDVQEFMIEGFPLTRQMLPTIMGPG